MSDPKPDGPPDTTDPDGTPVENPSGALTGPITWRSSSLQPQ